MKVVLLCRVSTNSQDYDRQVNELTIYCQQMNWVVKKIFANKVSGAKRNEERPEIMEMIEYVRTHEIDRVCVLEISRLGRNTLEALKVIQLLDEKGICLYVKNYNLETIIKGKVNPVASLICTILLEIAQMECKADGIKMGRPTTYKKPDDKMKVQYAKEISLLKKGLSLRQIQAITGTSIMTIRKLYRYIML